MIIHNFYLYQFFDLKSLVALIIICFILLTFVFYIELKNG